MERGHLSWSEGSGDVVARFESAGISIRDCVVLVAALGSVELAAAGALGGKTAARVDPEDDEDEMSVRLCFGEGRRVLESWRSFPLPFVRHLTDSLLGSLQTVVSSFQLRSGLRKRCLETS